MSQWLCWWISGVTRNHRPGSRLAQQKGLPALAKRPVEAEAPNNSADWTHHSPPAFPLPLLLLVFPPTKIGSRLLHTTRFRGSKNHERWEVEAWLCRWFQGLEIAGLPAFVLGFVCHLACCHNNGVTSKGSTCMVCLYSNWCPTVLEDVGLSRRSPTQYTCCPSPSWLLITNSCDFV